MGENAQQHPLKGRLHSCVVAMMYATQLYPHTTSTLQSIGANSYYCHT